MRYELWQDGDADIFLADDDTKAAKLNIAVGIPQLIWWVEAESWNEACTKFHEYRGWEPYQPMEE